MSQMGHQIRFCRFVNCPLFGASLTQVRRGLESEMCQKVEAARPHSIALSHLPKMILDREAEHAKRPATPIN
jgi:hypothetical protein